ncbi:MAG TPA: sulfatase-like hydrolase/transferase [Verrucomicrobiae bacterium]|nr:sulfatase-like hydrolase/transferase [Verrucomicrobiae bacterium]
MKPYRLALCLALLSGAGAAHAQESLASIFTNADRTVVPEHRPSIILIQCHGLGYGDLSCYGQTNYQTPNIDRLASEGIRFTNFHQGGTNFTTALATLLSGQKSAAAPALASQLQTAGYHTGLVGEWTLDGQPWKDGFDEFGGFLGEEDGRNYFAETIWRYDTLNTYDLATRTWVDLKPGAAHNGGPEALYPNRGGLHGVYLPELFTSMACKFVEINAPDRFNRYKPFFLVLDLPQPRSASATADEFPVPSDAPFTGEAWPQAAKDRASLLTRLDGSVQRLITQLKNSQLTNNVAIFIASSEAPEKFKDPKMNFLSVNGTAVAGEDGTPAPLPMIAWFPGEIPAGQVSNFKWTGTDFLPTALQIAYVKPPKDLGGMSILPVLQGKKGQEVDLPTPKAPPGGPGGIIR